MSLFHRSMSPICSRGPALELLFGFLASGGTGGPTTDVVGGPRLSLFSREQERLADLAAPDALHALAKDDQHVCHDEGVGRVHREHEQRPARMAAGVQHA